MNAAELRLGNWVTVNNPKAWAGLKAIPMQVESVEIKKDDMFPDSTGAVGVTDNDFSDYSQFDEFIEPIPLTEEWLTKFGWRYYNGRMHGDMTMDTQCKIDLDWVSDKIQLKGHYEPGETYRPMSHIKYVHQLQNLYFALTGQELTIQK